MPLFTFYPCRPDGSSIAFEALECDNDLGALETARRVLREHRSAVEVVIWHGERQVGAVSRVADPA
jgi:hypothetical protein